MIINTNGYSINDRERWTRDDIEYALVTHVQVADQRVFNKDGRICFIPLRMSEGNYWWTFAGAPAPEYNSYKKYVLKLKFGEWHYIEMRPYFTIVKWWDVTNKI